MGSTVRWTWARRSVPYFGPDIGILECPFSVGGDSMSEAEQLSSLIGNVYDAALDRSLWVDVLGKAAQFVGGQGGGLLTKDAVRKSDAHYTFGVAPHYVQLYLDQYAKLDPASVTSFFYEIGQVTGTSDFMPYDEFLETRFYREWGSLKAGWMRCK